MKPVIYDAYGCAIRQTVGFVRYLAEVADGDSAVAISSTTIRCDEECSEYATDKRQIESRNQ